MLAHVHVNEPDVTGWITVSAYVVVVVVALLRQWFGWGRSWRVFSSPGTLLASVAREYAHDGQPLQVVYCAEHSRDVPMGTRAHPRQGLYLSDDFSIVVPAATGVWRWSYIIATGQDRMGRWRWRRECARNALTRRFEEPDIGGCPECIPVKALDPKLDRTFGTTRYV